MRILLNVFYSLTCLLVISVVGLVLTKHLVITAEQRMINVVDDNDHNKVLFQMPTNVTDYVVNFVK